MSRQIGLRDIHIATLTKDDGTGATYETPVKLVSRLFLRFKE